MWAMSLVLMRHNQSVPPERPSRENADLADALKDWVTPSIFLHGFQAPETFSQSMLHPCFTGEDEVIRPRSPGGGNALILASGGRGCVLLPHLLLSHGHLARPRESRLAPGSPASDHCRVTRGLCSVSACGQMPGEAQEPGRQDRQVAAEGQHTAPGSWAGARGGGPPRNNVLASPYPASHGHKNAKITITDANVHTEKRKLKKATHLASLLLPHFLLVTQMVSFIL